MEKLRIGVIGPGNIFRRVMTDRDMLADSEFTAVASSKIERARAAAEKYGIRCAFGSYEEMAASDEVDLVYIATPHNFHKDQAILCMEHKKHVIVEKPIALNEKEFAEMTACAKKNGVFLMEAMWTWLMPAIREVKQRAERGDFGLLRHIEADFAYRCDEDPENRLFSMKLAGGSLLDVGVYVVAIAQLFAGAKAQRTETVCRKASTGADTAVDIRAEYPGGVTAKLYCGTDRETPGSLELVFSDARVHVPDFWHAESYTVFRGDEEETVEFQKEHEGHHYEFDHAAWCINRGLPESPILTHEASRNVIKTTEEIRVRHGILYPEEL